MAKTYEVKVHVNLSESDAAAARQAQQLADVERQAKKAGEAQEKAAKKAADAQVREVQRAADAQAKAAQKVTDAQAKAAQKASDIQAREAKKAADAQVASAQKTVDAQAKATQKLADAQAASAKKAADAQIRDSERAQARITALADRALTDQEIQAKAQGAIHQRLNDKRVATAIKVADAERTAGMGMVARLKETSGLLLDKINPGAAALAVGVGAASVATQLLSEKWRTVAEGIKDSIAFTTKYRDSLPENAALKGHLGDTTTEARDSLLLRSKTLQTLDQAKDFEAGLLNTGQASLGKRILQPEFDKLKVQGGSFQAAEKGNATTHGELLGRLPALMKLQKDQAGNEIPLSADQVMGEESRIFNTLQLGGSNFSSGVGQLLKNSSLTSSGLYRSIGQQTGLQSMFSLNSPESAGDLVNQFTRATVGSLGRMRGVGVEGSQKTGEYLNTLKATDQMDPIEIGKLISADMTAQGKTEAAKGRQFNAYDYLKHQGFGNQEEIQSLLQFHASQSSGEFGKFEQAGAAAPDAKPMQSMIASSRADPRMQDLSRQVTEDLSKFAFDRANATADQFRRQVFAKLVANKELSGKYEENQSLLSMDLGPMKIQAEADQALHRSAKRVGVQIDGLGVAKPWQDQTELDEQYQGAIDKIQAAGGDPFADLRGEVTNRAEANLNRAIKSEAPGRAGLAKRAAEDRFKGGIPNLIAAPGAMMPPEANDPVPDLIRQLLGLTQQQFDLQQKEAEAKRAVAPVPANRPAPAPLPVMGPGRISPRP